MDVKKGDRLFYKDDGDILTVLSDPFDFAVDDNTLVVKYKWDSIDGIRVAIVNHFRDNSELYIKVKDDKHLLSLRLCYKK